MLDLNTSNFDEQVGGADSCIVMFHGIGCAPCATMKPVLIELARELGLSLFGVSARANRALVEDYGLRSVPTLIAFKQGVKLAQTFGGMTEVQLRSWIAAAGLPTKEVS